MRSPTVLFGQRLHPGHADSRHRAKRGPLSVTGLASMNGLDEFQHSIPDPSVSQSVQVGEAAATSSRSES